MGQLAKAAEALERFVKTADPEDPGLQDAQARLAALRLRATGVASAGGR